MTIDERYASAKAMYATFGVDTDKALATLKTVPISMHCWQGDDVKGFERDGELSGGIQTTGNYPGRARNFEELKADIRKAFSLIPGKHRINLHASYAIMDEKVDRDALLPKHFAPWVEFAKELGVGIDFNPTFFAHPMADSGLTLSSPDENVRNFWIRHGKASRRIAEYLGRELNTTCLCNLWIPDGYKDVPTDRLGPRARLKAALDEIYSEKLDPRYIVDSVESKVFGIGVEAYTVGSHEFYMNYAAKNGLLCLMDNGHYHPTEVVSDKIPSMLLFSDKVALHVTRGVRWDSDHVVLFDDELKEIAKEIVRCNALDRVLIGLDFFDASINRICAWVVGMRNMIKALLNAMLLPSDYLRALQDGSQFSKKLAVTEDFKTLPFGDVWAKYCADNGAPGDCAWFGKVAEYEKDVLSKRA